MAISYVGHTLYTDSVNQSPRSFSHTVPAGADRLLLVALICYGTERAVEVRYGGVRLSRAALLAGTGATSHPTVEVWGLAAPAVGTGNVVVTFTTVGTNYACIAALNYAGVDAAAIGAVATNLSASGTTCSCDITTTAANSIILGVKGGFGGDTYPHSPGAGVTERVDERSGTNLNFDAGFCVGDMAAAAPGAYTWSVDQAVSDDWAVIAVELLEAGSGAPRARRVTQVLAEVDLGIRVPLRVSQVLLEVDLEPPAATPVVLPPPYLTGFFLERAHDDGS